jgi:hypothetical protein
VVAEHRLIAERMLGRPLQRDEVVQHVDGDPLNNASENLQVMSRAEHLIHHLRRMPVRPFSREEVAVALALRASGMTIDQVANELGRSYFATRRRLQRTTTQAGKRKVRQQFEPPYPAFENESDVLGCPCAGSGV